jgi:hypothetical protein
MKRTPKVWAHSIKGVISAVHLKRTPGARLSPRLFAHRGFNAQKAVPSCPDTRSSESIQDLGPTAASDEFRTVGFEGRVAPDRAVSAYRSSRFRGARSSPYILANAEKRHGSRHTVTARGHLEERKELRKGAEAPNSVTERPVTTSSCHRTRPQSWSSLGVNESKKGWLKPLFIH